MTVTTATLEPAVQAARVSQRRGLLSATVLRDIVVQSITGLYHHWFRATLSMLGISWGIVSVVVLLAYGDGFRAALEAGFAGAFGDGVAVTMLGLLAALGSLRMTSARGNQELPQGLRPVPE